MLKIGDYVTRKKYNNDIVFKIIDINNNKCILKGIDIRLIADSNLDDLVLTTYKSDDFINDRNELIIDNNYFFIPGTVLHFDMDNEYIIKCKKYYDKKKIKNTCISFNNKSLEIFEKYINKYKPDIVVVTGHDSYNKKNKKYKNSELFKNITKMINKKYPNIIIISGACQSDFIGLLSAGASFASSPTHSNIHALDPAIIASYIALSKKYEIINIEDMISKTYYGKDSFGGIVTNGCMNIGYPRKEKY